LSSSSPSSSSSSSSTSSARSSSVDASGEDGEDSNVGVGDSSNEAETSSSDEEEDDDEKEADEHAEDDETPITFVRGRPKPRIRQLGQSDLLSRISTFLPRLRAANEDLEREIVAGRVKDMIMDDPDQKSSEPCIEMVCCQRSIRCTPYCFLIIFLFKEKPVSLVIDDCHY
jgi:hypothetical protein